MAGPLEGIRVLDFGTLLPVPMAALILAEAGAEVTKIERPGGDPMRRDPAAFALLNRGKRSLQVDLKRPESVKRLMPFIREADVLIEQFRPGVMQRLGLGYEALREHNPGLIYCSVTGYGATGPMAQAPGHDLTYAAEAGMLSLTADAQGVPGMPAALVADIGGGTLPAVLNVLLALIERNRTGVGCAIEVAMYDNLFPFLYWAQARGHSGRWPAASDDVATGCSPRYRIYATKDRRFLAVGAVEPQFWAVFCETIGLAGDALAAGPDEQIATVAALLACRTAAEWEAAFADKDTIVSVVRTAQEAFASRQAAARGLFSRRVPVDGVELAAMPVPLDPRFRSGPALQTAPQLDPEWMGQET